MLLRRRELSQRSVFGRWSEVIVVVGFLFALLGFVGVCLFRSIRQCLDQVLGYRVKEFVLIDKKKWGGRQNQVKNPLRTNMNKGGGKRLVFTIFISSKRTYRRTDGRTDGRTHGLTLLESRDSATAPPPSSKVAQKYTCKHRYEHARSLSIETQLRVTWTYIQTHLHNCKMTWFHTQMTFKKTKTAGFKNVLDGRTDRPTMRSRANKRSLQWKQNWRVKESLKLKIRQTWWDC